MAADGVFLGLLVLALLCRLRPPARLVALATRVLGWFGAAADDDAIALGDCFGVAGFVGLLFDAWSERWFWSFDGVAAADALACAIGAGLAAAWLLTRGDAEPAGAEPATAPEPVLAAADVGNLPPSEPAP